MSAEPPAVPHHELHRLVEATTMALYVSIALLAALAATSEANESRRSTLLLIWGTALGLAIAHYVAFRLASALARGRHLGRDDIETAGVQFIGAMTVPLACTVAELALGSDDNAIDVAEFTLAGALGVTGYLAGRTNGASRPRAALLGGVVLVIGFATATVKFFLTRH
jgi:hypothetical protein